MSRKSPWIGIALARSARTLLRSFTVAALFLYGGSYASAAPQIWFSSGDDLNVQGVVAHPDFMRLFDSPSPWPTGLARINVMQLRPPWFLRVPPETDQKVVEFLKRHNISLAVPFGFVNSENCGQGIEGLGSAREHNVYPREMKKRGVPLDYAVMDEPLYYGHDYGGKNSCQFPVSKVAATVVDNVKMIRAYYPNIQFVWVEPPQGLAGGPPELAEVLDDYKTRLGEYPVSVRFDIAWGKVDKWTREWHADLPGFIRILKTRGIGYGIIYDAGHINGRLPKTNQEWISSAKANVADWKRTIADVPNQVIIQTWTPNPVRVTPESDPSSMTGYLKWFIEQGAR